MTWDQEADTLHFSGKGYKDRIGMKFGFRCKIAFDTDDLSVTVQFPETFQALYSEDNNMHYVISLVNTYSRWVEYRRQRREVCCVHRASAGAGYDQRGIGGSLGSGFRGLW